MAYRIPHARQSVHLGPALSEAEKGRAAFMMGAGRDGAEEEKMRYEFWGLGGKTLASALAPVDVKHKLT